MQTIELETLVTLVCTEFVKQNKSALQLDKKNGSIKYLKMNFKKRKNISSRILDSIGI